MVSKGVDYYTYVGDPEYQISVTGPKVGGVCSPAQNYAHQNLQIQSHNIHGWTGKLNWEAFAGASSVEAGDAEINTLTGNLEGGTMSHLLNTPSSVGNGYALSYGFYDAGSGHGTHLTNQDQLYVYLTDNHSQWMGTLAATDPHAMSAPFYKFVLPGAHDAGMFTLSTVNAILQSAYADALLISLSQIPIIGPLIGILSIGQAPRVITNLALTQKDDIRTMLNLGIRYFDFRPGTLYSKLLPFDLGKPVRYHQHKLVPGYGYVPFLEDVLRWLSLNPTEIVVVNANKQGFAEHTMIPSAQDLLDDLNTAMNSVQLPVELGIGDKSSLGKTYADLVSSNTRLILLNEISSTISKYDSYNVEAYATLDPAPIIGRFEGMSTAGQQGNDYTVLQLQGTATGVIDVIPPSVATLSDASSPLMSTKAKFDIATVPWLLANVTQNLTAPQPIVILNDFADNCMTEAAIALTKTRLAAS